MDELRRTLLKNAGINGLLFAAFAAGLIRPEETRAAEWNAAAFASGDLAAALRGIGAIDIAPEDAHLSLLVPDIAENGAMVPVTIASRIPHTQAIALLVENNPVPLAAFFELDERVLPEISLRIKFAQSSQVMTVAMADGRFYSTRKTVRVETGGCDD